MKANRTLWYVVFIALVTSLGTRSKRSHVPIYASFYSHLYNNKKTQFLRTEHHKNNKVKQAANSLAEREVIHSPRSTKGGRNSTTARPSRRDRKRFISVHDLGMIPMFLVLDLFDGIRDGPDHLLRWVRMVRVETGRLLQVADVAVDDLVREHVEVVLEVQNDQYEVCYDAIGRLALSYPDRTRIHESLFKTTSQNDTNNHSPKGCSTSFPAAKNPKYTNAAIPTPPVVNHPNSPTSWKGRKNK
jgi:hypothetical protein